MKQLAVAWLVVLAVLAVGCRQEGPPPEYTDTYSGAGDEVFHLGAAAESFGYTLDLGSAVKDVYFIFTNPSSYA
ncbi:MAG: hypothetical protein JW820_13375, partial [Spirochaetales bacterium]|nr:hypothetical protein [Spirochaetales bacterium]